MILITQLIYIIDGQEKVFDEFESIAIPTILKYNGRLLLRIRPTEYNFIESHIDKPYEIHLVEFQTQQDFDYFLKDEERKKFLHLKEQSTKEAILIQGTKLWQQISEQTTDDTKQKIRRLMNQFFKEIFEYSHHFNQKLFDIFSDNPDKASEKSVKLFNHILNAHQIWNNRIDPKQPTFRIWELHDTQDLKNIDKTNYEQTLHILNTFDLNETISYSNSKGQAFNNNIRYILFYAANHSTYHRGQIATEFKQHGLEPLVTDYIFYKR